MPLSHRNFAIVRILAACLLVFLVQASRALAHAGHAALPTKGTQVDVKQGTVFLSREAREALGAKTAEVELQEAKKSILAFATLESPWTKHAFATSRVGGRIESLFVKPGQSVEAGQPLAEVRSLELETLQLELLSAENNLALSEKLLKQSEPLARDGVIAGRELMEAATKNAENQNAVKVARLKLLSLGRSDGEIDRLVAAKADAASRALVISSPISGVVTHADLSVGKVVEPNEHLFEIVDLSSVWVRLGILEKDTNQVAAGQRVELTLAAFPGETFPTEVKVKNLALDPKTRLGTAWGELTNPIGTEPKFLQGMNGQARIVVYAPGKRTAVPSTAVIGDGAERFVLVEEESTDKGSQYRKRNVIVDAVTPEQVFLRGGEVFPGDRVLTQGAQILASYFVSGVFNPSDEAKANIGLRFEKAGRQKVEETIELEAIVDVPPNNRAVVSSQVAGTLEKLLIDRGQVVHTGDVLAELASLDFQNLQLSMLQADQQLRLLTRRRKLLEEAGGNQNQIVSRRQLWELESSYSAAALGLESSKRKLEGLGLSTDQVASILSKQELLSTLPLRSPIDGTVVHFDKALGQAVKAEEPLFEIHNLSHVWVQAFASESQLPRIRLDSAEPQTARVRLTADPNAVATGKVVRSGRAVGDDNRTLAIWIELDHPPATPWQHNMLASVTLATGKSNEVLAVPREAVAREGSRAFVFVERPDGMLERRAVETNRSDDRFVEIVNGLKEQEMVAVSGAADLQTAYAVIR